RRVQTPGTKPLSAVLSLCRELRATDVSDERAERADNSQNSRTGFGAAARLGRARRSGRAGRDRASSALVAPPTAPQLPEPRRGAPLRPDLVPMANRDLPRRRTPARPARLVRPPSQTGGATVLVCAASAER